jgi:hypothetical protein
MAWILCSKKDVTSIHPIAEADILDEWSDFVEDLIRDHMGQPYLGTTEDVVDEYHNGSGSVLLNVRKPPIVSVNSLTVSEITLSPSDYIVFGSYIQLKNMVFPVGNLNVAISYTSGSLVIKPTVRLTAAAMIVALINYKKRFGADTSIKWGNVDQKGGEESPNQQIGLADHLKTIMKRFLKRDRLRVH